MTTAIDTNVLVALWNPNPQLHLAAQSALDETFSFGPMTVAGAVYAELLAAPGRDESFLDSFFSQTGILIDWDLNEAVWRTAGWAFRDYAARRIRHREPGPRRILADFLIGAHALENGYRLLTLDDHLYRAAFPSLKIVRI